MPLRVCPRCHFSSNLKRLFRQHLNRKFPCKPKYDDVPLDVLRKKLDEKPITIVELNRKYFCCKFCKKSYTTHNSLKRHLKTTNCETITQMKNMQETIISLQKTVEQLKNNPTSNITNSHNTTTNSHNKIVVNVNKIEARKIES